MQCTRKQVGGIHVFLEVCIVFFDSKKSTIIMSLKKLCCPILFFIFKFILQSKIKFILYFCILILIL